jgi:hypothetical protein
MSICSARVLARKWGWTVQEPKIMVTAKQHALVDALGRSRYKSRSAFAEAMRARYGGPSRAQIMNTFAHPGQAVVDRRVAARFADLLDEPVKALFCHVDGQELA